MHCFAMTQNGARTRQLCAALWRNLILNMNGTDTGRFERTHCAPNIDDAAVASICIADEG
jgi:hypothetical protein